MPICTSGRPILVAESLQATRQSHTRVSSVPPPTQTPWIAATVGTDSRWMRANVRWPPSMMPPRRSSVIAPLVNPWRSAPAMNILPLAERKMTPWTEPSFAALSRKSRCALSSSKVSVSKMLAGEFARSKVTTQMPSLRTSRWMFLKSVMAEE